MKQQLLALILTLGLLINFSFTSSNPINNGGGDEDETKVAMVSYYGSKFHGKLTASGEPFDMNEFTCAHKTLKFGTKVEFTNPKNGKSIVVTVNDRGPFVKGRKFDLSKAAFSEIANVNQGVAKLHYKILK